VTITNNAPACLPVGITQVTWTATAAGGNSTSCNQVITVLPASVYYRDRDGDGFGNPGYPVYACSQPAGFITDSSDCNDYDATQNSNSVWYADADGDGYGDPSSHISQCSQPAGYVHD